MTIVTKMRFVRKFPLLFTSAVKMITGLNSQTKGLSFEFEVKMIRQKVNVNLTCFWNLTNSTIQAIWKNRTKIISAFVNRTDRE